MQSQGQTSAKAGSGAVELLAPGGNWESVKAACANGANAIYFGLPYFNARIRAGNFTEDNLPELMDYLHSRNVSGYLALNTLIYQHELEAAGRMIELAASSGVDALIVQDAGLAAMAAAMSPTLPLHASTQMTLSSVDAFRRAERLGISRVILPRELPLAEIETLAKATPLELEVFVHGALCISYSGQCQASLALGGRSANRGECAQPCRLPYTTLIDGTQPKDGARRYPLSPCDLSAWSLVPQLIQAGVKALKIEGRLKDASYVAAAVRLYRAAIDAAAAGRDFTPDTEDEAALRQTFSRGFSRGFMGGAERTALVDGLTPKPRGLRIGSVCELRTNTFLLQLDKDAGLSGAPLKPGDGIVFTDGPDGERSSGGRIGSIKPIINRGEKVGQRGRVLEIALWSETPRSLDIRPGATLWKTDDPQQEKHLKSTYAQEKIYHRSLLSVKAEAHPGEPLRLIWQDSEGRVVEVRSSEKLERAGQQALTRQTLSDQLGRLGDTPFALGDVEFESTEAVMAPKSLLNSLRREAVEVLLQLRRVAAVHALTPGDALARLHSELQPAFRADNTVRFSALLRSAAQARAVLQTESCRDFFVWLDLERSSETATLAAEFHAAGQPFGLATPRITRSGEEARLETLAKLEPTALLLRSIAALEFFRAHDQSAELVGDAFLHAANAVSVGLLLRDGLSSVTPTFELTPDEVMALAAISRAEYFEIPIYARLPLFHTEHCLFAAELGSLQDNGAECSASCRNSRLELLDRKGARHAVLRDENCRNTVFSAEVRDWRSDLPRLRSAGLRSFRVEALHETPSQLIKLLESLKR